MRTICKTVFRCEGSAPLTRSASRWRIKFFGRFVQLDPHERPVFDLPLSILAAKVISSAYIPLPLFSRACQAFSLFCPGAPFRIDKTKF
jgi:hypothetical protein